MLSVSEQGRGEETRVGNEGEGRAQQQRPGPLNFHLSRFSSSKSLMIVLELVSRVPHGLRAH